ncbi:helix-turn-helix transcriptional regulator [Candidatus Albibeggiatoa sp. nov. NOAA]|uniref:helix-turn-helix domain-containing protein n=1 Tax=Candidatus Albibeggiatoa sp. nov. NOAA TaxID=3162724 RepID=UPI00330251DD|nr:helix-turn-helix domain-containing protein [Thiotrichaceae bacterium]
MRRKGVCINGSKLRELRLKQPLSQEKMSEQSFYKNCYMSPSTIKRAELCFPISVSTLEKLAKFFDTDTESFLDTKTQYKQISNTSNASSWQQTTIDWNSIPKLADSQAHQKLSSLCQELQSLLSEYSDDEQVQAVFQHWVKVK